jgi:hypothetical protein
VIDNAGATPIAGAFGNLADGAIVTVNGNTTSRPATPAATGMTLL